MQLSSARHLSPLVSFVHELKAARWLWCLLFVAFVAVRHFMIDGAQPIGPRFGDTDDALRLVQVRDFLINGAWYDIRLTSIGAPEALNSHWSRLIDLPVAWLISVFALFTSYLHAEMVAQIVWPLLVLFGLARFMVHEVERRGATDTGAQAGLIVLGLLFFCPTGLLQFNPGRLDHHNVQIACAVAGLLLLQAAFTTPSRGWWAGAIMAIGLVVGFEALPLLASVVGLACLFACFNHSARSGVVNTLVALAAGLAVGHLVTTHPALWLSADCDKLGFNLLALVAPGVAAAAVLFARFRDASQWVWLGGLAAAGVFGIGLYLAANPVCAGGAFVGMDPYVKTHWLDRVIESQSLIQLAQTLPSAVFSFLAIMSFSLVLLIRQAAATRAAGDIFWAAMTLLAGLYGFYYMKFMPYGALLSLIPVALWIVRLPALGEARAEAVRLGATVGLSQTFALVLASTLVGLFSNVEANSKTMAVSKCTEKTDIAALSQLPAGLIVSEIDLGPYIALSTGHRAYAGPYHRIHQSIRDVLRLHNGSVAAAGPQLARMKADYVVLCADSSNANTGPDDSAKPTFMQYMIDGGTFAGLQPVAIKFKGPLKVWKVVEPSGS